MKGFFEVSFESIVEFEDSVWNKIQNESSVLKEKLEKYNLDITINKLYIPIKNTDCSNNRYINKSYYCNVEIGIFNKDYSIEEAEKKKKIKYFSQISSVVKLKKNKYFLFKNDIEAFFEEIYAAVERIEKEEVDEFFIIHGKDRDIFRLKQQQILYKIIKIVVPILIIGSLALILLDFFFKFLPR